MYLPQVPIDIVVGVAILIGAVECFFGFKIFKVIMGIAGFIVAGLITGAIGYLLSQNQMIALMTGVVGGLIGAVLAVALYFVGVFFIGALFGSILGIMLYATTNSKPEPAVILILAIIIGVLAVILQKFVIILSTSFSGAWIVVIGAAYFLTGSIDPTSLEFYTGIEPFPYAILLCWILLGIMGVLLQYRLAPPEAKKTPAVQPVVPVVPVVIQRAAAPKAGPAAASAGEMVECPICGRYISRNETFRCKNCQRPFICMTHQDKSNYLCEECNRQQPAVQKLEVENLASSAPGRMEIHDTANAVGKTEEINEIEALRAGQKVTGAPRVSRSRKHEYQPEKGKLSIHPISTREQPEKKILTMMICPKCKLRVLPKSDGSCPSCQSKIA